MTLALVFPGQGSQAVGMGMALADTFAVARTVFEEVDTALGEPLSKLMRDGPEETLTLTQNAQPALMAVSLAALRVLESECGLDVARQVKFVAGHSLGEYSALAAAGTFTVGDAALLLRTRGRAMQAAVPVGEGAMAALLGVELAQARALAAHAASGGGVCEVANDNAPGQVVVSGSLAAVERAVAAAKDFGVRRAILLKVSAPFHCSLMAPAADIMSDALHKVRMRDPVVPLIANVLAGPVGSAQEIRQHLVAQVTGTVRWRESVAAMAAAGVTSVLEVGAGKVLAGLVRQTERAMSTQSVGTPDDLAAAREAIAAT
ncbi:MAG: ACP S-malonyltransferase [Rhizobiales bacterium]|nr:ACP S-malonyltransferase [Hyphomicrobiales bacterium]